jgi:hypothetical protein
MTLNPKVCDNIQGGEDEDVQWTNPTTGCTIDVNGTNPFPFAIDPPTTPPVNINPAPPTPAPKILIKQAGSFVISCCNEQSAVRTVTVTDRGSKRRK